MRYIRLHRLHFELTLRPGWLQNLLNLGYSYRSSLDSIMTVGTRCWKLKPSSCTYLNILLGYTWQNFLPSPPIFAVQVSTGQVNCSLLLMGSFVIRLIGWRSTPLHRY